ncbi:Tetraspanin-2A-like 2 [Homarus americanus]|uniref:Tetraspanin-2A-like 2 n=1 Tax=Homarus americanus TaxID=6706 RepID=A0A8J5K4B8_HOMAM|nr:Tetraspanin-2A-like 2 [Homarus americanus]
MAGAAIFALGLWILFDKDMGDYIPGLGMFNYWNATTGLMVAAALVMVSSFLACCGAYFKSTLMIIVYKVLTVVTFIMLLVGSGYILAHGLEDSQAFPVIQEAMRNLIYQYQWDMNSRRTVDIIQEYVGCCGGYSASDYTDIHMPIPDTCRDQFFSMMFAFCIWQAIKELKHPK